MIKNRRLENTAVFCARAAWALFALLAAVLALRFFRLGHGLSRNWTTALYTLLGLGAGVPLLRAAGRLAVRLGRRRALAVLLALCLAVKLAWVLLVRVAPAGDYATFQGTAAELAGREVIWGGRYIALFPHVFGYSFFLSLFMKLFGQGALLAPLLNVGLSVLSCWLLYDLADRLSGGAAAAGAALLWTFFPSQTIYNMYVLSEPLYTALILAFFTLIARFDQKEGGRARSWGYGLGAGLALALVNLCRPVGVILLLALACWLGLARLDGWRERGFRRRWLTLLLALVLCCLAVGRAGTAYLERRIGEAPASTPGYSFLVGFNLRSGGTWNREDADLLDAYSAAPGSTAPEVQRQMLAQAAERIREERAALPAFLYEKLHLFLGDDSAAVAYGQGVIARPRLLSELCNGYYYACFALAALAALGALRRGERPAAALLPGIYVLGLTLAQLLVEVAGRYHYSALPTLVLLAAWCAARPLPGRHGADTSPR